jgi:hypothetical protein
MVFIVSLATAFIWNILPSYEYLASYAQKARFCYFYKKIIHLRIIPSYQVKTVYEKVCAI